MDDIIKSDNTFSCFVPFEIISKGDAEPESKRMLRGLASTSDVDLQDESIVQDGLDLSYFRKHGYINSDHSNLPADIVGEPTKAEVTSKGLMIECFLYKNHARADQWWSLITAQEASGAKRRVGFSVEGKVIARKGNKITKCWIRNVAITAAPVNTNSWAEVVKSLNERGWGDIEKSCTSCANPECGGDLVCKKATTTASAGVLVPESLEGKPSPQIYKSMADIPDTAKLSYDECVTVLQLEKGWSRATAQAVVDVAFIQKGLR